MTQSISGWRGPSPQNFSPQFLPTMLGGCSVWLRSDQLVTTGATFVWGDLSGNATNPAQATAADQPTVSSTGGPLGGPAVVFNGTTDVLTSAVAANIKTLAAVLQFASVTIGNYGIAVSVYDGVSNGYEMGSQAAGQSRGMNVMGVGSVSDGTTPAGVWESWIFSWNGSTWAAMINGSTVTLTGATDAPANTNLKFSIGARIGGSLFFAGSIVDVVGYSRPLNAQEMAALHTYHAQNYGV